MLALFLAMVIMPLSMAAVSAQPLPLPNASFENGAEGWSLPEGGMGAVTNEQAATGSHSLKIVDTDGEKGGSNVTSARVPIEGPGAFELRWKTYPVSGSGCGVYVRVLNADGKGVVPGDRYQRGAPKEPTGEWVSASLPVYAPGNARFVEIWIHSYSQAVVTCYLDDFELVPVEEPKVELPWEPSYKLRPDEKARLTPADFPGPDGIVYPDWTYAGVPGGIPEVPERARIEEFGGIADDDNDDSAAVERACAAVGERGGGAVVLGEGTYYLDRPVSIYHDNVVIRGQGPRKTRLIFRYALPPEGIAFYRPEPGSTVGPNTQIEVHTRPAGLLGWRMEVDGTEVASAERGQHWGNTFQIRVRGSSIIGKKLPDGPHTLKAIARYKTGDLEARLPIAIDSAAKAPVPPESRAIGAIMFCGRGLVGPKIKLAEDGKRGDLWLELDSTAGLKKGSRILLEGPATERWKKLTWNACQWGNYRRTQLVVEQVNGKRVHVNQPLRIEFPVVDESYVQRIEPIRRCGIESLTIEQTENLWISSTIFSNAWECWARDVEVKMCGRWPVYALEAKWCEIRDCVFDDAWFKGGGGTAYVGWEHCCDCLMDRVRTFHMRHAPCYQWAASGNVIRRSVFHDSDAQWHSGWTNENLYEQCIVESSSNGGSYGYGMWASPPQDTAHGPNGPRNVVYNCDISSPKTGLWMGGMNENWLILYNRFVVEKGPAVYAKDFSFDHIIRGNVFVVKDEAQPGVHLATPDCVGAELIDNTLYGGNGEMVWGAAKVLQQGNQAKPLAEPDRPEPAVESIFEWQRERRGV
jgi:hypothetical protein